MLRDNPTQGSRLAETRESANPLNLIRVIPAKGAKHRAMPPFQRMAFSFSKSRREKSEALNFSNRASHLSTRNSQLSHDRQERLHRTA
jgi:hypothetical protein